MQTSDDTSSKAFAIKKYQKNVNGKASTEKFDMTMTRKHPLERKDDQVSLCDETHNNVDKNIWPSIRRLYVDIEGRGIELGC
jgi:hypothetical protein